jgi:uncharacterized protein YdaU (DUF1376 family)
MPTPHSARKNPCSADLSARDLGIAAVHPRSEGISVQCSNFGFTQARFQNCQPNRNDQRAEMFLVSLGAGNGADAKARPGGAFSNIPRVRRPRSDEVSGLMALGKPSWFKLEPASFLSDGQVDAMSTQELGACLRLLCRQWIDGYVPDDLRVLGRLCRLDDKRMREAWITLSLFFPEIGPGKRANRFMWVEREKVVAELERRSDDGTRAANKRWNAKRDTEIDGSPNGSGMPAAMQEKSREEQSREQEIRTEQKREEGGFSPRVITNRNSTESQLAEDLLNKINLPATAGNVSVVAASITAVTTQFDCCLSEAGDFLEMAAEADRSLGVEIDRFWFEDAKYKAWADQRQCTKHPESGLTVTGSCWACYSEKHRGDRPEMQEGVA